MRIMRSSRAIWILATAFLALYLASINNEISPIPDSTAYLLLAESLITGQGYSSIYHVGNSPHATYPFVFPVILAPLVGLFGRILWLSKGLIALFAFASVVLCYRLFKGRVGHEKALVIAALTGLHPIFGNYAHAILTEVPFLCFTLLFFMSVEKYDRNERAFSMA
ncbi:hypothetical protein ACFLU6_15630, partial [Acidobacteriota bacterium]